MKNESTAINEHHRRGGWQTRGEAGGLAPSRRGAGVLRCITKTSPLASRTHPSGALLVFPPPRWLETGECAPRTSSARHARANPPPPPARRRGGSTSALSASLARHLIDHTLLRPDGGGSGTTEMIDFCARSFETSLRPRVCCQTAAWGGRALLPDGGSRAQGQQNHQSPHQPNIRGGILRGGRLSRSGRCGQRGVVWKDLRGRGRPSRAADQRKRSTRGRQRGRRSKSGEQTVRCRREIAGARRSCAPGRTARSSA